MSKPEIGGTGLQQSINDILGSLRMKKVGQANTEPSGISGNDHPTAKVDDGTQAANDDSSPEYRDKVTEVKKMQPNGVSNTPEATSGKEDAQYEGFNIGQNSVGDNPSVENNTQTRPSVDQDTNHPASISFGEKYASDELNKLVKIASDANNALLEVAAFLNPEEVVINQQAPATQQTKTGADNQQQPTADGQLKIASVFDWGSIPEASRAQLVQASVKQAADSIRLGIQAADVFIDRYKQEAVSQARALAASKKVASDKKGSVAPVNPKVAAADSESDSGEEEKEEASEENGSEETSSSSPEMSDMSESPSSESSPESPMGGGGPPSGDGSMAELEKALAAGSDIGAEDAAAGMGMGMGGGDPAGPPDGGGQQIDEGLLLKILEMLGLEGEMGGGSPEGMNPPAMDGMGLGGDSAAAPEGDSMLQAATMPEPKVASDVKSTGKPFPMRKKAAGSVNDTAEFVREIHERTLRKAAGAV